MDNLLTKKLTERVIKDDGKDQEEETTIFPFPTAAGHIQVHRLVTEYGGYQENIDAEGNSELINAIVNGDTKKAIYLISIGADPNVQNMHGQTALMLTNNPEIITHLLTSETDLDRQDMYGFTALMYQVLNNNLENVQLLDQAGADLNVQNIQGQNALHLAINEKMNDTIIKYLIVSGSDVNLCDIDNVCPLESAIKNKNAVVVQYLIVAGAYVDVETNNDYSMLEIAKQSRNKDIIKIISQYSDED